MDSLTHIVVGAALGELTLGKKIGNKAIIVGAAANTIPDLDVFFTRFAGTPAEAMHMHRGFTHAFFFHPFIALPLAFLLYNIFRKKIPWTLCYFVFLSGFITHVLMDGGTAYGTQMLLPFNNQLVSWNNLAVVDPLFTIAPLLFFMTVWFFKKENDSRRKLAAAALVISLLYVGTATVNKFSSAAVFKQNLEEQHIQVDDLTSTPTMFTSWLWNMVAYDDSTLYLGEYSVFQQSKKVDIVAIKRHTELLKPIEKSFAAETLVWFSQGRYFVQQGKGDTLDFFITKWGRGDFTSSEPEKMFPFYSKVYADKTGVTFKAIEPDFTSADFHKYFSLIHNRIFE